MVGRRDAKRDILNIQLTRADLTGAILFRANLANANLTRANLTIVDLTGADLTDARLTVFADLTRADLANLTRADLTSARLTVFADLTGADLTGARWPEGAQVPDGWTVDSGSGRLSARAFIRGNSPLPLITSRSSVIFIVKWRGISGAIWPEPAV